MLMLPSLGTGDKLCIFKLDIHLSSGPQAMTCGSFSMSN